jgi:AI-2 transport protein TqsA
MIICSHIPELRGVAVLLSREGLPDTESDLPDMPRGHEDDAPTSVTRNSTTLSDNQTAAAGE